MYSCFLASVEFSLKYDVEVLMYGQALVAQSS